VACTTTLGPASAAGNTWDWEAVRGWCSGANHSGYPEHVVRHAEIPSQEAEGEGREERKTERCPRDHWIRGNSDNPVDMQFFLQKGLCALDCHEKGEPFAPFQIIAQHLIKDKKIRCGAAMLKSVETRFASRHPMTERVMHMKVYRGKGPCQILPRVAAQAAQDDPSGGTHSCV
jgi:hypothetical protein